MDNKSGGSQIDILIVDDSPTVAELLRRSLSKAGYGVRSADNGAKGLQILREHPCALVMSDVMMPVMNGYRLCREIKQDRALRHIPVILLTALSEPEDIIEAIKAGADSYLTKPFDEDMLLEQIRSLLNLSTDEEGRGDRRGGEIEYNGTRHVITADSQQILNLLLSVYRNTVAQNRELINTRLQLNQLNESLDRKVQERTAALQKSEVRIRTILNTALDAFISTDSAGLVTEWNAEAEKMFGYVRDQVLGKNIAELIIPPANRETYKNGLKGFWETGRCPLVGGLIEETAMRSDGSEFPIELSITAIRQENDVFFNAFIRDITERKLVESKVSFLAYHDQLTALPNRELFYDRLSQAVSQARRKHSRLFVLFLDLDGFKAVNDSYGHEAGDIVLKTVARRLQACVRNVDTVARLGGDEFTIILSEVENASDVANVAEKIILKLTEPVVLNDIQCCGVGVSIGIACYPEDGYELDKLMSSADSAMYKSKTSGKSTYTFFQEKQSAGGLQQPWVTLDATYLLGVPELDQQHQKLASMINRLNDAVKQYAKAEDTVQLFDDMIAYAKTHFEDEERLIEQSGYIEDDDHRRIHQRLIGEAKYMRRKFVQGDELLVLQFLKDWLFSHITEMDKQLAAYLLKQRGNQTS